MESIFRISSPYSEPWVAWLMVVLLVFVVLANSIQRNLIANTFVDLFSSKERGSLFNEAVQSTIGQLMLLAYKTAIIALTAYLAVYNEAGGDFSLKTYFFALLLTIAYLIIKYVVCRFLSYVFLTKQQFQVALRNYINLSTVLTTVLYPVLLILLFSPFVTQQITIVSLLIVVGLYYIAMVIKALQLFFSHIMVSMYIFLYLCSVEIIPLSMLVLGVNYFAN